MVAQKQVALEGCVTQNRMSLYVPSRHKIFLFSRTYKIPSLNKRTSISSTGFNPAAIELFRTNVSAGRDRGVGNVYYVTELYSGTVVRGKFMLIIIFILIATNSNQS